MEESCAVEKTETGLVGDMRLPPEAINQQQATFTHPNFTLIRLRQRLAGASRSHTSEEAAREITDGTENPSPPGESRSLICGQTYAAGVQHVNKKLFKSVRHAR